MNLAVVDKIAKAVLYEGYMLYPYRPSSVKNQQRWNFGVLCPRSYSEAQKGSEAWTMQTECLVQGSSPTMLEIRVRFLQLVARSVGELTNPVSELPPVGAPEFHLVARLEALDSEPVTSLARVADVSSVEPGTAVFTEEASAETFEALLALT